MSLARRHSRRMLVSVEGLESRGLLFSTTAFLYVIPNLEAPSTKGAKPHLESNKEGIQIGAGPRYYEPSGCRTEICSSQMRFPRAARSFSASWRSGRPSNRSPSTSKRRRKGFEGRQQDVVSPVHINERRHRGKQGLHVARTGSSHSHSGTSFTCTVQRSFLLPAKLRYQRVRTRVVATYSAAD